MKAKQAKTQRCKNETENHGNAQFITDYNGKKFTYLFCTFGFVASDLLSPHILLHRHKITVGQMREIRSVSFR